MEDGYMQEIADHHGYVVVACDWWGMADYDVAAIVAMMATDLGDFVMVPDRLTQGMVNALALMRLMKVQWQILKRIPLLSNLLLSETPVFSSNSKIWSNCQLVVNLLGLCVECDLLALCFSISLSTNQSLKSCRMTEPCTGAMHMCMNQLTSRRTNLRCQADKCSVYGINMPLVFLRVCYPLSGCYCSARLQGRFVKDSTVSFHGESVINSKNTFYYGNSLGGIMGEVYMAVTQDVVRGETVVPPTRCIHSYTHSPLMTRCVCCVSRYIRCCWWALWATTTKKY